MLGLAADGGVDVSEPLDRSMLARLATVVGDATEALAGYDHTTALAVTESFFWQFCDDYIELVKARAYGDGPAAESARAALRSALETLLRLFAPFLPFVTEEVWSWWRSGSVHTSPWPEPDGLTGGDAEVMAVVAGALSRVRRAKSDRNLSMRAGVTLARVSGPPAVLERLALASGDLRAAGHIATLDLTQDSHDQDVTVVIDI